MYHKFTENSEPRFLDLGNFLALMLDGKGLMQRLVPYFEHFVMLHIVRIITAAGQPVTILGLPGVLDGGYILPGFTLAVKEIFPE